MANEYLKRTLTSSGNSRRWTISFWMKNSDPTQGYTAIMGAGKVSPNNVYNEIFYNGSQTGLNLDNAAEMENYNITANPLLRDPSAWMHVIVSFTDQGDNANTRIKFYINGAFVDHNTGTALDVSETSFFNDSNYIHYIGSRAQQSYGGTTFDAQYFDVFMVDGQALTPDVFGFYKDGKGYQSSGSLKSTDFRSGQWSPHSPRKIKSEIERRGGFGTNGFYLPMNDSSNVGADFHCTPNTIIKLKGEDLPQPRNGAPTTSDSFVSQVRKEIGELGFAGCIKVDNYGGLVVPDHSDLDLGTSDFTVEGFYYIDDSNGSTGYHALFDFRGTSGANGQYLAFFRHPNGHIYLYVDSAVRIDNVGFPTNKWTHVALSRSSGTTRLFVDGVEKGSFSDSFNYVSRELKIGHSATQSNSLRGFISNFRVVKGTAVYTSNFTRPTKPLENITNTIVLMAQSATSVTAGVAPASIATYTYNSNSVVFATTSELTGSLVYAIPGIATGNGTNLISNGNFEIGVNGWNSGNSATLSHEYAGPDGSGSIRVTSGTGSNGYAYRSLSTTVGQRYTLSFDYQHVSGPQGYVNLGNSTGASQVIYKNLGTSSSWQRYSYSFVATVTNQFIGFYSRYSGGVTRFANISLVQQDAASDYSAHIKGSGTNKTVTTVTYADSNNSLHRTPVITYGHSAYGSYIEYPNENSTGGYLEVADSTAFDNVNLTTAEWTYEGWFKSGSFSTGALNLLQFGNTVDYQNIGISIHPSGRLYFVWSYNGSSWGVLSSSDGPKIPVDEWCHIAIVKESTPISRIVAYVNGVAVKSVNVTSNMSYTSPNYMRIGGHYRGTNGGGDTYFYNGGMYDIRFYDTVKYKGGFDVSKPYAPVGIESWRTSSDTCKNNFATYNPHQTTSNQTLTNGNLTCTQANQVWGASASTIGMLENSGKYYAEWRVQDTQYSYIGMTNADSLIYEVANLAAGYTYLGSTANDWGYLSSNGSIQHNQSTASAGSQGATLSDGDIVGITFDTSNKQCKWYKNGTLKHTLTLTGNYPFFFAGGSYVSSNTVNFGQNPTFSGKTTAGTNTDDNGRGLFKYAPPTGFLALCEDNLPTPAIADPGKHFKTVLYTGDATPGRSITGVGFKPDLIWFKGRSSTTSHVLNDTVRGVTEHLNSDANSVASTPTYPYLNSVNNDGFSLLGGTSSGGNVSDRDMVAWCWKAGGPAVTNKDGQLTTQVSANPDAGFSIVTWLSNAAGSIQTLGHGLGKSPDFIIVKNRDYQYDWFVWHKDLANTTRGYLRLNSSVPETTGGNDTWSMSSTTFGLRQSSMANANTDDFVAYCWTEIEGYSKFGKYTGNGDADGPFVYCGFKPAWVMVKRITTGANEGWPIYDSSRGPSNPNPKGHYANDPGAENDASGRYKDFLSNGFKIRGTSGEQNTSGVVYVFAAFAESPFQTANAK